MGDGDTRPSLRIVLVQTYHPGNIGAAARAMKNMGLADLVLVRPRDFPSKEATSRAGQANDILANARVVDSLQAAITDCGWVIGTSARGREFQLPQGTPRAWAPRMIAEAERHPVAVVFGRERMGLPNEDILQCHAHMMIPAHPEYPVLNLAQALQVICYELYMAQLTPPLAEPEDPDDAFDYPDNATQEHFYQTLENSLRVNGFLSRDPAGRTMQRLKTVFKRARPNRKELNTLLGAIKALSRAKLDDNSHE